jgi:hypothetical protein
VDRPLLTVRGRPTGDVPPAGRVVDLQGLSWAVGAALVVLTTTFFVLLVPGLRHWLVFPVAVSGMLIVPDVVEWARGRLDVFDPQAMIAFVGTQFFFLSPLLHVTFDYWPKYVDPAANWPDALGRMALLNAAGLMLYRIVLSPPAKEIGRPVVEVDVRRLPRVGTFAALVSVTTFLGLVLRFGGPSGYLATMADDRTALAGLGPVLLIARAFPTLGFMVVIVRYRDQLRSRPRLLIPLVALLGVAQLLASGLSGSRSSTVWPVLIGMAMWHLVVRPMRRSALVAAFAVCLVFMYLLGIYKSAGSKVLQVYTGDATIEELSESTGRDLEALVFGDLSRADVQALTLERQLAGTGELGHGVTYLGDLSFLVPRALLPERPPSKDQVGTNILYGDGTYEAGVRSSRVYGPTGEGILNFGPVGAVLAFVPLGLLARYCRSRYRRAAAGSVLGGKLTAPTLSVAVVVALAGDFDNFAWFLLNFTLAVAAVRFLSRSTAAPVPERGHAR